jgi:hypothetical protein
VVTNLTLSREQFEETNAETTSEEEEEIDADDQCSNNSN